MDEQRETIAWQWWAADGTPGRWGKTHTLKPGDRTRTLCGLAVPRWNTQQVADIYGSGDGDCQRCRKAEAG